ncbi:uncharacterized mitochondrial protein AtMg00810-like isoform X2 [Spinacia oleracea]|uniref:Uncharacterized mitochondrial protein AtMg00810-like n=1 Tax=Spinacia oleracea TaxID=3562 RepID=A0ABM3QKC5_SPIOL|nr:uncharacterized mitochondrial protein AtMg00810-like isoform X2 [Spinacia oleracea]XP_056690770.1 uncharacterized mitochondrial protein AtMg00810-like isoform X2 [Spinacia oleracea]XP_056691503.1 uncharacterized mitochondrial protein AtMg00810-like [Spinacia oleracea]XP_056693984.1 uncharacterized mitochondrial protein AtMg00810-like isoform X2 [Spinacia oleracea]
MKEPEAYRRLVGRLVYLVVTLPDLAYSVYILSQFMQEPRVDHWDATLRVVRYLKGTPGQGILLRADSNLTLQGWCDSDWAVCPITRRSLTVSPLCTWLRIRFFMSAQSTLRLIVILFVML